MNKLFENIYWFKIFLSPFLFFNVIGIAFFLNNKHFLLLWVLLGSIGLILGLLWAEKIRRNKGTTKYLGDIYNTDDLQSYDEIIGKEDDKRNS